MVNYIQCRMVDQVFRSSNALDLATYIGFNDLKPSNGGWTQNPMWTVVDCTVCGVQGLRAFIFLLDFPVG